MGNAPSSSSDSSSEKALHVLRVAESSPSAEAGIEPFFDFIVGIDGVETDLSPQSLSQTVDSFESRPLTLLVYSSKRQEVRNVTLIPSREWSMPAPLPSANNGSNPTSSAATPHSHSRVHSLSSSPSLLGLSLRFCSPSSALSNVWHILEVLQDSPAESAGLVPYGDWIIGWAGGVLNSENDFYDVVEGHVDKPLRLYVYSYDFDTLREVVLVPNRQWGGEGLLGCGVGYGLLHRIPKPQTTSKNSSSIGSHDTVLEGNGEVPLHVGGGGRG